MPTGQELEARKQHDEGVKAMHSAQAARDKMSHKSHADHLSGSRSNMKMNSDRSRHGV